MSYQIKSARIILRDEGTETDIDLPVTITVSDISPDDRFLSDGNGRHLVIVVGYVIPIAQELKNE